MKRAIRPLLLLLHVLVFSAGAGCLAQADDPDESVETSDVTAVTLKSIAVTPTPSSLYANQTVALTATGKYSNATTNDLTSTVTWSSSNANIATVTSAGVVTTIGPGTATITAQSGTIKGKATVKVLVTLASIAVTPLSTTLPANTTQALVAMGAYNNHTMKNLTSTVTWTSSNPAVATVSNAGLVVTVAPGTATMNAITSASSATPVTGATTIVVNNATITAVAVTPATKKLAKGSAVQFTATATFSDGSKHVLAPPVVTWTSAPTSIATITAAGKATGAAVGLATITAKPVAGPSGTAKLTVTAATLTSVAVTPATSTITAGIAQQYTAMGTYTDASKLDVTAQVTWASSATAVATITSAGLATAVAAGTSTMTATDPKTKKAGTATLSVTAATLQSISLQPVSPSVAAGGSLPLRALGTFADGTTQDVTQLVTWTSSDPTVAAVSNAAGSQGVVTGLVPGSSTITAFDPATGVTQAELFVVTSAVITSLTVSPQSPLVPLNTTLQLAATATYSDGTTVDVTQTATWTSHNAAIVVSNAPGSSGQVTAVSAGSAVVSITVADTNSTAQTTVTESAAILRTITVTPASANVPLGTTGGFVATGLFSDGSTQNLTAAVTWSSTGGASISNADGSNGLATAFALGATVITATDPTTGITGTAQLVGIPPVLVGIAVTPGTASIPVGLSQSFNATGTYSDGSGQDITGSVTWTASPTGVAEISAGLGNSIVALADEAGTTTITALDPATQLSASAQLTVTAGDAQVSTCAAVGLTDCGSTCVDTSSDLNNCGTCGNACATSDPNASATSCSNGQCVSNCNAGYAQVSSTCQPATANSCRDLHAAQPGFGDGAYAIDPDGAGPIQPLQVYCDMTTDGGGWTLVLKTDASSTAHYTASAVRVDALSGPVLDTVAKFEDGVIQAIQGTTGETRVESPNISWRVFAKGNSWSIPDYAGYPQAPQAKADASAPYQAGGQCYDSDWPCASDHYCFGVFSTDPTSEAPFLQHVCIRRFGTPGIFFHVSAASPDYSYQPGRVWVR